MLIADHPKVECKDTAAELKERMVKLRCRVRANPPIENARYVYTEGEETRTIKVGERVDSIYMRKEDGVCIVQTLGNLRHLLVLTTVSIVPRGGALKINGCLKIRLPMAHKKKHDVRQIISKLS